MKNPQALALIAVSLAIAMTSISAHAEILQTAHVFTLHDDNNDGSVDSSDDVPNAPVGVPSFFGFVSRSLTFTEETFVEFNISGLGTTTQATLSLAISNNRPDLGSASLPIATYSGSGETDTSLYRVPGNPFQTLQVDAPQSGFCCTFNLDVTGLYNQFKSSGFAYLGFRLHDPSWSSLPSEGQVFFISARLDVSAPRIELSADIDIAPGAESNPFNPKSNGVFRVAILTTGQFNATQVNASTVRFGASGTEAASVHTVLADVDRDGDLDMVVHVRSKETGISCGTRSAVLTGRTLSGATFRGQGALRTVGCKK